jgi:hypothetical protein
MECSLPGNQLQCDCDLIWYKQWLVKAESSTNNYVSEARPLILKTKCWSERDRHEYMVMQVINSNLPTCQKFIPLD